MTMWVYSDPAAKGLKDYSISSNRNVRRSCVTSNVMLFEFAPDHGSHCESGFGHLSGLLECNAKYFKTGDNHVE